MNKFKLIVTSPTDREYLVVEIWLDSDYIAELRREGNEAKIEFYLTKTSVFGLDDFSSILELAKKELYSHRHWLSCPVQTSNDENEH